MTWIYYVLHISLGISFMHYYILYTIDCILQVIYILNYITVIGKYTYIFVMLCQMTRVFKKVYFFLYGRAILSYT